MLSKARVTKFKNAVLGRSFDLSLSYVNRARMRVINRRYRSKNAPTDVLSFALSKQSGEIILCNPEVRAHARSFGMTFDAYLPYLVIHGLVHIKGHTHGRIMDGLEQKYCRRLGVHYPGDKRPTKRPNTNGPTHRSRH